MYNIATLCSMSSLSGRWRRRSSISTQNGLSDKDDIVEQIKKLFEHFMAIVVNTNQLNRKVKYFTWLKRCSLTPSSGLPRISSPATIEGCTSVRCIHFLQADPEWACPWAFYYIWPFCTLVDEPATLSCCTKDLRLLRGMSCIKGVSTQPKCTFTS